MIAIRPTFALPFVLLVAACSMDGPNSSPTDGSASGSGGDSGSGTGGGGGGGGGGGSVPEPSGPIRYPHGLRHSPLSKTVVERWKGILATSPGRTSIFAKVGDSNTVNTGFATCFGSNDIQWGPSAALEPARAFFGKDLADGAKTSFERITLAAKVGWSSGAVLAGDPSPLAQEIAAITPAFAVVLLGTNDTYPQGIEPFAQNLLRVVDELAAAGVVPWLTTLPQRDDNDEARALVPEMNAVVRAVAQARQAPLMDLFGTLAELPDHGLVGDGIHLQSFAQGGVHACWFDAAGLGEGMNRRNLLTIEALDRARRFLLEGEAPEPRPKDLAGEGTWESPFEIDALPFVDDRDTAASKISVANQYSCSPVDEGGSEVVYRLTLTEPTNLRIRVFDAAGVDIDVHFMEDPGGAALCVSRADKVLDVNAGPGTYWISADTYVSASGPLPGPYLFTVVAID
ncbi:SGNH/GDSL hydrolase family protein [Polyangium sp. 15x6]|uniref:SGNH/GDSL hydrolase family protein n=1 Tax=Polyangium sp. 15x6 TaxID=3042687 RepID=UPI00249BCB48|nr:SGNH/GDSL hydrolase family protein [Polyangium sp. 15x6]MDI3289744.1 SGNH/GDSL hydrolase family protein [Polyangium sp. 15x6]